MEREIVIGEVFYSVDTCANSQHFPSGGNVHLRSQTSSLVLLVMWNSVSRVRSGSSAARGGVSGSEEGEKGQEVGEECCRELNLESGNSLSELIPMTDPTNFSPKDQFVPPDSAPISTPPGAIDSL